MSTSRVFFALWPPTAVAADLAQLSVDVAAASGGRAPQPAALHVTLAFVGEVPVERLGELMQVGAAAGREAQPFPLMLDHLGFFAQAQIAWAGCTHVPAPLTYLANALRGTLRAGGYRTDDRPFRAHVTLARRCVRRPPELPVALGWHASSMALVQSRLGGPHAQYENIGTWPLGHAARVAV